MFRKIQSQGRSLQVITPADEVLPLGAALRPEGLAILLLSAPAPKELDDRAAAFYKMFHT